METGNVSFGVIEKEASCACLTCGKVLSQGKYGVGVIHTQDDIETKYVLGVNPHLMCCGEFQEVQAFFDSQPEADAKATDIQQILIEKQHLGGAGFLKVLLEFHALPLRSLRIK